MYFINQEANPSVKTLFEKAREEIAHLQGLKEAIKARFELIREYNTYYDFFTSKSKFRQSEEQLNEINELKVKLKDIEESLTKTNKYLEDELQYFNFKLAQNLYALIKSYTSFLKDKSEVIITKFNEAEKNLQINKEANEKENSETKTSLQLSKQ